MFQSLRIYKIYFGSERRDSVHFTMQTYHNHYVGRQFAFEAYPTLSKVMRVEYTSPKTGNVKRSYYKVVPGSRGIENYKLFYINGKNYKKILNGLVILRWWRRVNRRSSISP